MVASTSVGAGEAASLIVTVPGEAASVTVTVSSGKYAIS